MADPKCNFLSFFLLHLKLDWLDERSLLTWKRKR